MDGDDDIDTRTDSPDFSRAPAGDPGASRSMPPSSFHLPPGQPEPGSESSYSFQPPQGPTRLVGGPDPRPPYDFPPLPEGMGNINVDDVGGPAGPPPPMAPPLPPAVPPPAGERGYDPLFDRDLFSGGYSSVPAWTPQPPRAAPQQAPVPDLPGPADIGPPAPAPRVSSGPIRHEERLNTTGRAPTRQTGPGSVRPSAPGYHDGSPYPPGFDASDPLGVSSPDTPDMMVGTPSAGGDHPIQPIQPPPPGPATAALSVGSPSIPQFYLDNRDGQIDGQAAALPHPGMQQTGAPYPDNPYPSTEYPAPPPPYPYPQAPYPQAPYPPPTGVLPASYTGVAGTGPDGTRLSGGAPNRLLTSALLPTPPETASGGWRKALFRVSGGAINPGPSPDETRHRRLVAHIRTPLYDCHRIAVMSLKGGVGKTTTTVALGSTLASLRGDRVVAIDANPDRGTLGAKVPRTSTNTVRDLLDNAGSLHRYVDVRRYLSQADSRLEVLASANDPEISQAFADTDYMAVDDILQRHYSILLTDCGTGILHSAMPAVLKLADTLVIVGSSSADGGSSASATLDWLEAHGHAEKVREAVTVISTFPMNGESVDVAALERHFAARTRRVVLVPYDPHLATGGRIVLENLRKQTRQAFLEIAGAAAERFGMAGARPTTTD